MSLVRWFRKNNKKVMAVVVIVILFGFIGGGTLLQQFSERATGLHETIAYFEGSRKITRQGLSDARRELDILRALQADTLLRNQDLRGIVLGELLFTEQRTSPALLNHIKQTIRQYQYRISDKQINDIYRRSVPSSIYWMLLNNEAKASGIMVSNEQTGELLGKVLPQMYNGRKYSQIIQDIMNQYGLPEQRLLEIFSELLAIMQYAQMICSNEDITNSQITQAVAIERESISANLVEFESSVFTSTVAEPTQDAELAHFEKYKKFVAGDVSDENPFGFGYMLPDRVQLEYIAVRLDDVAPLVKAPTSQEKEDYYNRNRLQSFTEQVQTDPNDPNSPMINQTKSYAEVIDDITQQLLKNKINAEANRILQEAKTNTDPALDDTGTDQPAKLTTEKLKEMAGDYGTTAEQLGKKHNLKIYAGKTGQLSPEDVQKNEYLARLYLEGYGKNPISLAQIVFAVDDLTASELGPFDVLRPGMYQNIGPLKDLWGSPWSGFKDTSGQIMALVRVIKTAKAAEPQSIGQTFSTKSLTFETDDKDDAQDVYSVREKVTEDLKKLAAMEIAKSKAEEFISLAAKDGWDSTIEKFNELYGKKATGDPNDPDAAENAAKPFKLQNLAGMRRVSKAALKTMDAQSAGNPAAPLFLSGRKKQQRFVDKLYSLVPQDSSSVDTVPLPMEFKPDMSFYCIKSLSVKRISLQEYEKIKAMRLQAENYVQSESMVAVHFNPENILKRMNFKPAKTEESEDENTPEESETAS
ncbi:MAG: hypothetical protein H8D56_16650 [Planctomycetes bacterium]|nr:hypothetical protein [Planctomycetota bacterium]MBL7144980.1 hypothetical protein [Phycisphaerae bacterium]